MSLTPGKMKGRHIPFGDYKHHCTEITRALGLMADELRARGIKGLVRTLFFRLQQ